MALVSQNRRTEQGAVSTIVVVLLSAGVMLGFLALSADFGRVVLERRELQNGADAGALAVAQSCAEDEDGCDPQGLGLQALVNANADDGEHTISLICGTASGLDPCPDAGRIEDIRLCPPLPEALDGVPYVEVRTQTSSSGGATIANIFGSAAGGEPTSSVDTCARAAWGSPGTTGPTIPLTISVCAWKDAVSEHGYAPSPPYSPGPATPPGPAQSSVPAVVPQVTSLFAGGRDDQSDGCGPAGTFGWLDDGDEVDCSAEFDADGHASGDPDDPTESCTQGGMEKWLGEEVLVPLFIEYREEKSEYRFAGISSFYLAGWNNVVEGGPENYGIYRDSRSGVCRRSDDGGGDGDGDDTEDSCVWGWFTSPIVSVGPIDPTVPPRGVFTVQMAG